MAKIVIDDAVMDNVEILAKLKFTGEAREKAKEKLQEMVDYMNKLEAVDTEGVAAQCTLPTLETTVADETLTLSWTAGSFTPNVPTEVTMPTFSATSYATDIATAEISSLPTFKGTAVDLEFSGDQGDVSVNGTPEGTVDATFAGTGKELVFTGTETSATGTYTPAGTVAQAEFTGTQADITVD